MSTLSFMYVLFIDGRGIKLILLFAVGMFSVVIFTDRPRVVHGLQLIVE